jgi:hypothetical protein
MDRSIRRFGLDHAFDARRCRRWLLALAFGVASSMSVAWVQAQEMCGGTTYPFPYTDVSAVGAAFCPGIMEAYVTGISKGTSPTTFSPNNNVPRLQMTTFLQRTVDQVLTRGSRRAALNQWWTPQSVGALQTISVGGLPNFCAADGENIWASTTSGTVVRVQTSTSTVLGTWTGVPTPQGVIVVAGKVFVTGGTTPGVLYLIDPALPPGAATNTSAGVGDGAVGITFDGSNLWTANRSGSVTIIDPQSFATNTYFPGFNSPYGILYDGAYIWVTDFGAGTLLKLDSMANILKTVVVGATPETPVFDGANIWVPSNAANSVTVVQASTGNVVATISADATNKLSNPNGASFDGERVLITNGTESVTVFKAADLSFVANVATGPGVPTGPCSDGVNFWVNTSALVRF